MIPLGLLWSLLDVCDCCGIVEISVGFMILVRVLRFLLYCRAPCWIVCDSWLDLCDFCWVLMLPDEFVRFLWDVCDVYWIWVVPVGCLWFLLDLCDFCWMCRIPVGSGRFVWFVLDCYDPCLMFAMPVGCLWFLSCVLDACMLFLWFLFDVWGSCWIGCGPCWICVIPVGWLWFLFGCSDCCGVCAISVLSCWPLLAVVVISVWC